MTVKVYGGSGEAEPDPLPGESEAARIRALWLSVLQIGVMDALEDSDDGLVAHRWIAGADASRGRDFIECCCAAGVEPDWARARYSKLRKHVIAHGGYGRYAKNLQKLSLKVDAS